MEMFHYIIFLKILVNNFFYLF
ncbi:hypothetical protein PFMALIP_05669 [Plasmodium falciparum MaliPS096_E11]|uniref:Uncharacterized protein n=1 Tax=Plasmodium falciparum MaliPS096_E11 TaxID=1036727 RepID=A0A024WGX7_PLAFA|nr:hypothetical protein PFMALIP_05669 [Plasmodium falciparum MaliPS096_E11]